MEPVICGGHECFGSIPSIVHPPRALDDDLPPGPSVGGALVGGVGGGDFGLSVHGRFDAGLVAMGIRHWGDFARDIGGPGMVHRISESSGDGAVARGV